MAKQTGCIDRRLTIGAMLVGRSDIRHLAEKLLKLQDGKIELSEIQLSEKQVQIGKDIAKLVGPVRAAHENGHPVGLKLPLLAFSPYYLLHNATSSTAPNILNLPRHRNEIAAYLHETLCGAFVRNGKIFHLVLSFTIDQMADFLCHARAHHPVLFLLILSRETELALKLIKALPAELDGQKQSAALRGEFFPQAEVDLADILGLLRNLQRAIPLIVAIGQMSGLNTKTLKRMVADLKGGHIAHADKKFHRRINVTVEALRKIALLDIDRHNKIENGSETYKFERCETDRETLDRYLCLTGEDTNYNARVEKHCHDEAVLNLPTARPPSNAPPKRSNVKPTRQTGRGGSREANLANYYGFSRDELALLLAIITNNEAGTTQMTARQTAFAAAILAVAGYDPDAESDIRDRQTNRLKESEALAFPSSGQMLHGVGFSLESWKDPERDKPLWKTLTKSNGGTDDYAKFFLQCRDYFYILTHRVKVLRSLDRAARVFCYMAQCVGLLSTDPIWIRLLQRAKLIARPSHQGTGPAPAFGPGPKTIHDLVDSLDPISDDP